MSSLSSLRRLLWGITLAAAAALVLSPGPRDAFAVEVDPYLYRTLIATITFEYQKSDARAENGIERKSSYFQQSYSLDSRGNIYSRRLLIYDAGVSFIDYDYDSDGTNSTSTQINYYLRTTLLSRSTIPLTLHGSRRTTDLTVTPSKTPPMETTTTTYGFSWMLKMRRPPTTTVSAERSETTGRNTDTTNTNYRVQMRKEIGPTDNNFNFSGVETDNEFSGTKSDHKTMSFTNRTKISKNTRTNAAVSRSTSKMSDTSDSTIEAANMSLTSRPSSEFDQTHTVTAYRSKSAGTQEGRSYSGNLNYVFSARLKTHLDLAIDTTENDTPTSKGKNDTIATSASAVYQVWKNLTVSENVSYYTFKTTTPPSPENETLSERTLFKATTNVNYFKELDWAHLSTQYSIAYIEDKTSEESKGKGLDQSITVTLSEINVNRYANFSASTSQSYTKPLSGNISGRSSSYSLGAYNKVWKKYLDMGASYQRSTESSWISLLENKREGYGFNASSSYFRNTKLSVNTEHVNSFTDLTGFANTNTTAIAATHARQIYGGSFTGAMSYSFLDFDYPGRSQRVKTSLISGQYQRRLTRRIFWEARLQRTESATDDVFTIETDLENKLGYSLRAWFFALEHTYKVFNKSSGDSTENIIYLMATRSFFRRF